MNNILHHFSLLVIIFLFKAILHCVVQRVRKGNSSLHASPCNCHICNINDKYNVYIFFVTAAVGQSIRPFSSHAENLVFAKRSATGVTVTGPRG